jgi:hypothetical protein
MKRVATIVTLLILSCLFPNVSSSQIPLPDDIKVIQPASSLPKEIAAFSGAWKGVWDFGLELILIVEEIDNKKAKVIYAHGKTPEGDPGSYRNFIADVRPGSKPKIIFFLTKEVDYNLRVTFQIQKDLETIKGLAEGSGRRSTRPKYNRITMERYKDIP